MSRTLRLGSGCTRRRCAGLLSEGVWNAVVIFRELKAKAKGYAGGLSILRDYMLPKRPLRAPRVTVRIETAPGEQLQHDWVQVETHVAPTRWTIRGIIGVDKMSASAVIAVFTPITVALIPCSWRIIASSGYDNPEATGNTPTVAMTAPISIQMFKCLGENRASLKLSTRTPK